MGRRQPTCWAAWRHHHRRMEECLDAPAGEECARTWIESEQCATLPGLTGDERDQCKMRCAQRRQQAFSRAVKNAHDACVELFVAKGGNPVCVLIQPDKSTMDEATIASTITSCTADCRRDGREAKAETQRAALAERAERLSTRSGAGSKGSSSSSRGPSAVASGAACCSKCGGNWTASAGACPGGDNLLHVLDVNYISPVTTIRSPHRFSNPSGPFSSCS